MRLFLELRSAQCYALGVYTKQKSLKVLSQLIKAKGVWLRGAICLVIGLIVLNITDNTKHDFRFQIRGSQPSDSKITLLFIKSHQSKEIVNSSSRRWLIKENLNSNSSAYWDQKFWIELLKKLTNSNVDKILINFKFDPSTLMREYHPIFSNPKIFWSISSETDIDQKKSRGIQFYTNELITDRDNIIRYYQSSINNKTHIIEKIYDNSNFLLNSTINFRGRSGTFDKKNITNKSILNPKSFSGKIIIIGTETQSSHFIETPVGRMNTSEVLANIIDNGINNRWINNLGLNYSILYLIIILIISIILMFSFQQSIALTYLIWTVAGFSALSLALFDNIYFWFPVQAPIFQIAATYILFLSHQLNQKDYKNWRLEEEQKLQFKSQQLKNNFVSLISHDLKTPIAKIQGICDRIISSNPNNEFINDLNTVRTETEELNKYIQSILQVTKVESKDFKIQKKPIDVNKLIDKVLSHLKFLLIEKQNKVDLNLEPIFLIEADPILIYEVFLNIVENSIKYAPMSDILIKTYETDNFVHILFKDTGPGITNNDLKYIFDKFYRAKDQKTNAKGSGLGLYLVKYFIQLHNGSINISSQIGAGTEIHIKLPIEST